MPRHTVGPRPRWLYLAESASRRPEVASPRSFRALEAAVCAVCAAWIPPDCPRLPRLVREQNQPDRQTSLLASAWGSATRRRDHSRDEALLPPGWLLLVRSDQAPHRRRFRTRGRERHVIAIW